MLFTKDSLQIKGHIQTESERMEKDIPCKWKLKKVGVPIFISEKIDFKTRIVTRGKKGH